MENGPFIDDFPINTSIYKGFSMAMLNNQMVGETDVIILEVLVVWTHATLFRVDCRLCGYPTLVARQCASAQWIHMVFPPENRDSKIAEQGF